MTIRHISAKKAWAKLSERAEHGEKFGFIACLGILYKGGFLTRGDVLARLNEAQITRSDLVKFREHSGPAGNCDRQSRSICAGSGAVDVSAAGESAKLSAGREAAQGGGTEAASNSNVLELPLRP